MIINIGDSDENADWLKTPENRKMGKKIHKRLKRKHKEEKSQKESLVAEIAAVIRENMGRGDVGAQNVAEWAIAQLMEGNGG